MYEISLSKLVLCLIAGKITQCSELSTWMSLMMEAVRTS
jgi:hypothetical protein